jgi:hypothetical protein
MVLIFTKRIKVRAILNSRKARITKIKKIQKIIREISLNNLFKSLINSSKKERTNLSIMMIGLGESYYIKPLSQIKCSY